MPGPLQAAGAQTDPTRYAALNMQGEQFTGAWTQASPYRDAATPYLVRKFYQGSRFDRIIDGINREISVRLTDQRRPGSSVWNAGPVPPALSFYSFKSVNNSGTEVIRVIEDAATQILDVTPGGGNPVIFSKTAGAGPARFKSVGKSLYIGDGIDLKKWIYPGAWQTATNIAPGTIINVGAAPGTAFLALGGIALKIVATQALSPSGWWVYVDPENVPDQFADLDQAEMTFSGLTVATSLNGVTTTVVPISATLGILRVPGVSHAAGPVTTDTGQGTTGNGTTGSLPTWNTTPYAITPDAGQQWKCYGPAMQNWGLPAPLNAPTLTPATGTRWWQPSATLYQWYSVLDSNQNLQVAQDFIAGASGYVTGRSYPNWANLLTIPGTGITIDGTIAWGNYGPAGSWQPSTVYGAAPGFGAILDSNQNLQIVQGQGTSGGSAPSWASTLGATTTDGGVTWLCLGPGAVVTTASIQYAFSTKAIDGSVSTASPVATIQGPILGAAGAGAMPAGYFTITGAFAADDQIAQIQLWRTPEGQSVLILEDQIPADYANPFTYNELGIPDTSANGGGALNAFISAPIDDANNPPPAGLTGMTWNMGRLWGFVGNTAYYSGGPDTLVGNGNTAWPPLNSFPFVGKIIKMRPVLVENGGMLVYTTSGIQIILGTGTQSNPFYDSLYCDKINLAGYNAEDILGSQLFLMEANGQVSSITIQYPFNPQSGYTEIGFPIGDQFLKVTTGGISSALYNPATAFLSWNKANTRDMGMYVADGAVGWFRLSMVNPPESGLLWSPRAAIAGGTSAVQSIETSPGVYTLLIGPASSGAILARDQTGTVWNDNGTAFPAWDVKGVILLCTTGQWTEVAHISAKSAAVGARPLISTLLGEIAPTTRRPFNPVLQRHDDPINTPKSESVFSDRYVLLGDGKNTTGDCIMVKFDYQSQAVADELLDWGIFASIEEERKEQAAR